MKKEAVIINNKKILDYRDSLCYNHSTSVGLFFCKDFFQQSENGVLSVLKPSSLREAKLVLDRNKTENIP